jgi:hypothetical protein
VGQRIARRKYSECYDFTGCFSVLKVSAGFDGGFLRSLVVSILLISMAMAAAAQQGDVPNGRAAEQASPVAKALKETEPQEQASQPAAPQKNSTSNLPDAPAQPQSNEPLAGQQQPKRILGFMPNYRAVSAGVRPAPPSSKQAFVMATQNSFDYSSFLFVGLTSLLAKGTDAHPDLGKGVGGYWAYTWRGFLDKTDGNYLVLWALPTVLHEDERYYAMGHGKFMKRAIYAGSSVLIAPNYQGHNTFNAAEMLGRAAAQAVSISYYPSGDDTTADLAEKFGYAIGRDALTNVFREFWPDIATHVLHRHP